MLTIWTHCAGSSHLCMLENKAWRVSHLKDDSLVKNLVDTPLEQALLLELMQFPTKSQDFIFREPPLEFASRFGTRKERSIWYGSILIETALAEKAFYLFNFMRASDADHNKLLFESYTKMVKTQKGIDLTISPFLKYRHKISSPTNYQHSQSLGGSMRKDGIEAFYYYSVRSQNNEINMGVFNESAFQKPDSIFREIWQCQATVETIEFIKLSHAKKPKLTFAVAQFLVDNELPFPAK